MKAAARLRERLDVLDPRRLILTVAAADVREALGRLDALEEEVARLRLERDQRLLWEPAKERA